MDDQVGLPLSDYDFPFPEELVAERPAEPRDSSRLLVLDRKSGAIEHRIFRDLPELLKPGDCLVLNRTKVLPCRLLGKKASGGKAEVLLVKEQEPGRWTALSSGLKAGMRLSFPEGLSAAVEGLTDDGEYLLGFSSNHIPAYLEREGLPPLPPYILKRIRHSRPGDLERYQTVYAREPGSVAAPTAGLHFTTELLSRLKIAGIATAELTLHVGRGTFRPITSPDAGRHAMLPERFRLTEAQAQVIARARKVVSVGTTSTRVLETLARCPGGLAPGEGSTDLYIRPGHRFQTVGALITNFHLPKSTPLLLAAAFAGRERLLSAYREAFRERYRLYSYGDAMLIK